MPEKSKVDELVSEIKENEKRDQAIKFGFDVQEMFATFSGRALYHRWEQKIALILKDLAMGKVSSGADKGEFICQTISEFERFRGFCLGIQWVLEDISSVVSKASRLANERKQEEES